MSAFQIAGTSHDIGGYGSRPKSERVTRWLPKGQKFRYDYDFGSTTSLNGSSIGLVAGGKAKVEVVARNHAIPWLCAACSESATRVCSGCRTLTCGCTERCSRCGEHVGEMSLPVVNSPRMGVCAYGE
jgi:hypothetical protein